MCLGAMYMRWRTPTEMAYRPLDQYFAAGGAFVDTVNTYGRASAERVGCISEQGVLKLINNRDHCDRQEFS